MRFILIALCLALAAAGSARADGSAPASLYANPQPSLDHPRKIVMSLSERDPARMNEIIGNVGNIISFRVGESDARVMQREFGNGYIASQFTDLGNYEVLVKRLEQGTYAEPFQGITLPPQGIFRGRRQILIDQSRQRYSTPRAVVEDRLRRWMDIDLLTKRRR